MVGRVGVEEGGFGRVNISVVASRVAFVQGGYGSGCPRYVCLKRILSTWREIELFRV